MFSIRTGNTVLPSLPFPSRRGIAQSFNAIGTDDWFNTDAFTDGLNVGTIAAGMAGSFVQYGLDDSNLTAYLNSSKQFGATLNRTIGTGITAGLEYGINGNTTLNLLNISDMFMPFGNNRLSQASVGLLEMRLGGGRPTFGIGMSGHNMSMGTMVNSVKGLDVYRQNARIKRAGLNPELTLAMRTLYSANGMAQDDSTMKSLYEQILSGKAKVNLTEGTAHQAKTTRVGGSRQIELNTDGLGELDMGVVLAHEAYRDGVDTGDLQKMETAVAAIQHMNVAFQVASSWGYGGLNNTIGEEARAFENGLRYGEWGAVNQAVASYDSSGDFWKLVRDDTGNVALEYDGQSDLVDENGNKIFDARSGGMQYGLMDILGISQNDAYFLMTEAGMEFDYTNKTWKNADLNPLDGSIRITSKMTTGANGQGTAFSSIASSHVLTDVITGFSGTLSHHDPMAIYDSLVTSGSMSLDDSYVNLLGERESASWWQFGRKRELDRSIAAMEADRSQYISFDQYKENNFILDMPDMPKQNDPLNGLGTGTIITTGGVRLTDAFTTGPRDVFIDGKRLFGHTGEDRGTGGEIGLSVYPYYAGSVFGDPRVDPTGQTYGGGNKVVLKHEFGEYSYKGESIPSVLYSDYLHLSNASDLMLPQEGQYFGVGDSFAFSGNSGSYTEGPHLHSGLFVHDISVNPLYNHVWQNLDEQYKLQRSWGYFFDPALFR
ncbi:MAG: M23 family metallopeptidase [Spirochaetaceae bacterium]|nr:M23 family metallopeptidase [Spirochaetaceae bacterium]